MPIGALFLFGRILLLLALAEAVFALGAWAAQSPAAAGFALSAAIAGFTGAGIEAIRAGRRLALGRSAGLALMLAFWALMPVFAGLPLLFAHPALKFELIYFEMVSAFTTTGASALDPTGVLTPPFILWRAFCAWCGGLFTLCAAFAILAPLGLGGYEGGRSIAPAGASGEARQRNASLGPGAARLHWTASTLAWPYAGATLAGALLISSGGAPPLEAACLSMGAIATAGFRVTPEGLPGISSFVVEGWIVLLMLIGMTSVGAHAAALRGSFRAYIDDEEPRYFLIAAILVIMALFLRHWVGAYQVEAAADAGNAARTLWGITFMAVSFGSTTGFESVAWKDASVWSGLDSPGVALLGLAMIGGGAASTAGGIKLIRAGLLARHSLRELNRLVHPHRAVHARVKAIRVGGSALRAAWVMAMLYALSLALCALLLSLAGLNFSDSISASIAALSNTGPSYDILTPHDRGFFGLSPGARFVFCVFMLVGRMETLALVALLNPLRVRI